MSTTIDNSSMTETMADGFLERTQLFQRWQAMKKEILLHKWYESEKAGYDVGFDRAATNWMIHHGCRTKRSATPSRS